MQAELDAILKDYVGRETPLYYAERLSEHYKRCALQPGKPPLQSNQHQKAAVQYWRGSCWLAQQLVWAVATSSAPHRPCRDLEQIPGSGIARSVLMVPCARVVSCAAICSPELR